jgi:hypothetical protein
LVIHWKILKSPLEDEKQWVAVVTTKCKSGCPT